MYIHSFFATQSLHVFFYSIIVVFIICNRSNLSNVFRSLAILCGFSVVDFIKYIIMNSEFVSKECSFFNFSNGKHTFRILRNISKLLWVVLCCSRHRNCRWCHWTTLNRLFNVHFIICNCIIIVFILSTLLFLAQNTKWNCLIAIDKCSNHCLSSNCVLTTI